ncbi:UDP-glucose 4-epimerase family protein [Pseudomonas asplenii]|uniref:UDP-glucose 4-epimerase family protein n=1 Tax=Pseudomonas asplenii TaxID=53407 RepID=UPI002234DA67|nr:SDR family oxidoreductase [Pseudomonas asplenii]UZE29970.1 SDR family oxidoreductase [Pseudomonas asplenii]
MLTVFLTGGTGFVGGAILRYLSLSADYKVIAGVRKYSSRIPESVIQIVGKQNSLLFTEPDLSGVDVMIHAAARVHIMNGEGPEALEEFRKVNTAGTLALAREAAEAGVKRFVFISSIKVNGEGTLPGSPYHADDAPAPQGAYGVSKLEAEQGLQAIAAETGMEVVIIRPVLVYGPGVKANFRTMMSWLEKGIPLPFGAINNKRSLVALDNLVDLIVTCIDHPAAVNQVFLVSDGEDLSTTSLLRRLGQVLGKPARLMPVPVWLLTTLAQVLGKGALSQRLFGSLQVDIEKNRALLDWVPKVSVESALAQTAKNFSERRM